MPKGTPRTATAASVILQQAATPEQEQVEYIIRQADTPEQGKRNDLTSSDMTDKVHTSYGKPAYTPAKSGNNAGLRQGETRITCIFRQDHSKVLHDWAKSTGHTFREVCLMMADRYIEEVVRPATRGERKLKNTGDVPEAYADMYDATPDEWEMLFK